jgi:hypothetical protein
MKIDNPFESGHIRNYILFYASVVVIMVLFFIASTLFNDVAKVEKKNFDTNTTTLQNQQEVQTVTPKKEKKFKLLQTGY